MLKFPCDVYIFPFMGCYNVQLRLPDSWINLTKQGKFLPSQLVGKLDMQVIDCKTKREAIQLLKRFFIARKKDNFTYEAVSLR